MMEWDLPKHRSNWYV